MKSQLRLKLHYYLHTQFMIAERTTQLNRKLFQKK